MKVSPDQVVTELVPALEAVSGGKYGTGRAAQSVEDCFLRHIGQLIESLKTFDMTLTDMIC